MEICAVLVAFANGFICFFISFYGFNIKREEKQRNCDPFAEKEERKNRGVRTIEGKIQQIIRSGIEIYEFFSFIAVFIVPKPGNLLQKARN